MFSEFAERFEREGCEGYEDDEDDENDKKPQQQEGAAFPEAVLEQVDVWTGEFESELNKEWVCTVTECQCVEVWEEKRCGF